MAATKDQRKLLNRCVMNEIPVFVLTGTDRCAMAALRAYAEAARQIAIVVGELLEQGLQLKNVGILVALAQSSAAGRAGTPS